MPHPELAEALDLLGGPADPATIEKVLPQHVAELFFDWLQGISTATSKLLSVNECQPAHLRATNSTWTSARLSPLNREEMLITIPAGLVVRLWVAYRLLLGYDSSGFPRMSIVGSLEDPSSAERPTPPSLQPLLRDFTDAGQWWSSIQSLDQLIPDRDRDDDSAVLTFASLEAVLSHEVAHILRRHLELTASFPSAGAASDGSGSNVQRALEIDADFAGGLILGASRRHLPEKERLESLTLMATAISGLLALFDSKFLRVFDDFENADYYHPKVRRGAYISGLLRFMPENELQRGRRAAGEGMSLFDHLMSGLERDVIQGNFGTVPLDGPVPIVNPLRTLAFQPTYERGADQADRDLEWTYAQFRARHADVKWP